MARSLMAGAGMGGSYPPPWQNGGPVNSGLGTTGSMVNAGMVNGSVVNGAMVNGPNGGGVAVVNGAAVNAGMVNAGMGGGPVVNNGMVNSGMVNSGVVNGGMGVVNGGANGGMVPGGTTAINSGTVMAGGTTMVGGGTTMMGGSPVTAVPVPNDPCGCGPAASAGECSGAACGAETMCCEPAGGTQSVQWVPATGGGYAAVTSYQFVGEGAGGFERQVVTQWYGWRLRKCCLGLLALLLLSALLYFLLSLFNSDEPDVVQPTALPEIIISTPAPEIVQPKTPETCLIFGDPHVKTFDGKKADYYTPGEYYIVKSSTVIIQGRYLPTKMTNHLSVTKAIAIGGPFIGNHKLIIDVDTITWDGDEVMKGFEKLGGTWQNADPAINIVYNSQGTVMQKSREGKSLHVVHIQMPLGVSLEINRWNEPSEGHYVNTRLTMPNQPGQDGHCGNFNGNPDDDSRVSVRARVGKNGVPQNELLFPGAKTPVNPGNRPDLNDCPEGQLKVAMEKCKAAEHKFFPSTACLIDTCLGHMTPQAVE